MYGVFCLRRPMLRQEINSQTMLQCQCQFKLISGTGAEDLQGLPWHWRIEIYNQKIWLSPAYLGPWVLAPSSQWVNQYCSMESVLGVRMSALQTMKSTVSHAKKLVFAFIISKDIFPPFLGPVLV
ncbi:hypothetical protein TNCV_1506501 [Trichonephila clavipes]|nr:hypothetical protein TNCV_1506501 [Trichonephila clavipes]